MYSFEEVQEALDTGTLSDALFKLERYGRSQGLSALADWAKSELNGYSGNGIKENSPYAYRIVSVAWKDEFGRPIITDVRIHDAIGRIPIYHGVAEFETRLNDGVTLTHPGISDEIREQLGIPAYAMDIPSSELKALFHRIRQEARKRLLDDVSRIPPKTLSYPSPNFTAIVPDAVLAGILARRWNEANSAFAAGAYLASIIMLGSILEGALLSKVENNPADANRAKSAPKDKNSGTVLRFSEWKLAHLIQVSYEIGWIKKDVQDFSSVVRDYRNYIHPNKERQEGTTFSDATCRIIFEVVSAALFSL